MKIIDKYKDYYDYMQGIYGADEKVVFDRRGSMVLLNAYQFWFLNPKQQYQDHNHVNDKYKHYYAYANTKRNDYWEDDVYHRDLLFEVGKHCYVVTIIRTPSDDVDGTATIKMDILKEFDTDKKYMETPLGLMDCFYSPKYDEVYINEQTAQYDLPILKGTCLTAIPAFDVWRYLYDYISSLNDVDFTDNRSDVQKAESHGFDKKTSFRHPVK